VFAAAGERELKKISAQRLLSPTDAAHTLVNPLTDVVVVPFLLSLFSWCVWWRGGHGIGRYCCVLKIAGGWKPSIAAIVANDAMSEDSRSRNFKIIEFHIPSLTFFASLLIFRRSIMAPKINKVSHCKV
jgi:hypothetical protein